VFAHQAHVVINKKAMINITQLGIDPQTNSTVIDNRLFMEYVNLRLAALGLPVFGNEDDYPFMDLAKPLIANFKEFSRDVGDNYYCPADLRIMKFLKSYFRDDASLSDKDFALPLRTLTLDRYGMARTLSLPPDADKYECDMLSSYRVKQGVLHNPRNDRRTTKGVFHVAEGGLPVPDDKKAVPKKVFLKLFQAAFAMPQNYLELPFTSTQEKKAHTWISLYLRPTVCPEIPNSAPERSMEIRLFAPGNLASNIDFAESIFGNAGNPYLRENDAALSYENWTGHTGCIILAPNLGKLTKKELGLPRYDDATDRQRRDGMCWKDESELYNDGSAFKITARDSGGVIVTLISDSYFGYTKKEVKTQISFSANLYGQCEEEHSGGALAFSARDLGEDFSLARYRPVEDAYEFEDTLKLLNGSVEAHPDGYATDKKYPNIIYVDPAAYFSLKTQTITWQKDGAEKSMRLVPGVTYISPWGYKIEMRRPHEQRRWRLVGVLDEGVFCHKPATVSGGGKSEISKDISDAIIHGPSIVADFKNDIVQVAKIIDKNYGDRFKDEKENHHDASRKLLDERRTMGSVVKLLTPSKAYTEEYNAWLESIPFYIREFALTVKRHYRKSWGDDWQKMFSVDAIDGKYGNILKFKAATVLTSYLRVGFTQDGSWRTFSLRKDFCPSYKIQLEDDITASVVVPSSQVEYLPKGMAQRHKSVKFSTNCEFRLFQRPDDAVIRGQDKRAEKDMSQDGVFFSNFEPLTHEQVKIMAEDVLRFYNYTPPMRENLEKFLEMPKPDYVVSSAHPRIVDGAESKNVRYLQNRDDLVSPRKYYIAEMGARLRRRVPLDKKMPVPVSAVISGRRNNPASAGVRPLAVHGPLTYLELPELFMEYIASMTGKSPSTTGAGLEGAMTKGPFNALCAVSDLNAALVSLALTSYDGWLSSAGCLGPKYRIDHDVSLLIPEIWCRMRPEERDPKYLIENGMLEKCEDFEHKGKPVLASRLGWRITQSFAIMFFGRIFTNPASIFTEDMLKPELQDIDAFADGMDNIVGAHARAAQQYFNDGSIEGACPPLKALLHIMKDGHYEGKTLADKSIRDMFTRDNIIKSDWYAERIVMRQQVKIEHLQSSITYMQDTAAKPSNADIKDVLKKKIEDANAKLKAIRGLQAIKTMAGSIGADPYLY